MVLETNVNALVENRTSSKSQVNALVVGPLPIIWVIPDQDYKPTK